MQFNRIMRNLLFIIFLISFKISNAHDHLTYDYFATPRFGFVLKTNNDTLVGTVQIFDNYFKETLKTEYIPVASLRNKIIFKTDRQEEIKINFSEIKQVVEGKKSFAFYEGDIWRIIDTPRIVRVYEGYKKQYFNLVTNPNPGGAGTSVLSRDLRYSYVVRLGKTNPVNFYEDGIGYKKKFKLLFSYKENVMDYLNTIGDIKFDDIPSVIDHINSLYK
ncbi:MAG: hypothetical protein JWN78_2990 [Bacteroidota bacterium]|nr:hypothetical protein [Bacteroidota bacterium]